MGDGKAEGVDRAPTRPPAGPPFNFTDGALSRRERSGRTRGLGLCDASPWSTGLIPIDTSGPVAADVPPEALLGDAPHLQALHEPSPRLDLTPRHVLQQAIRLAWPDRLRRLALFGSAAVGVNVAFGLALFFLLSFRDAEIPREVEIPVEVIPELPKALAKAAAGDPRADAKTPGGPGPSSQAAATPPPTAPPTPTSPPQPQAPAEPPPSQPRPPAASPTPKPVPPAPPPRVGSPEGPKLVEAPRDIARAATQTRENKPANLQPDDHRTDQATREAKPEATPQVLTTADPKAAFAMPAPVDAKPPVPAEKATPPVTAKTPSAADMLAAALPMDTSAMPASFRAVLSGNSAAQIKAAYEGVVQGRLNQAKNDINEAAFTQGLKGGVAVLFTIDGTGKLTDLSLAQSSGDPKLDALALHWIEMAAPFPPPPSEAERTFRKALFFGN